MAVLTGLVDDLDILQNEIVVDMADVVSQLESNTTQFTKLLRRSRSNEAHRNLVEWLEDQLIPRLSALAASATSATTALVVTTGEGAFFRAGDVVRLARTGEAVEVNSIATDTLSVTRSIGSVAAATAASGGELIIIGNAAVQGATLGTRKIQKRVRQYNYSQIFRHPYGFTNTQVATLSYVDGGNVLNYERKKKLVEHERAIEYSLFWGARDIQATEGANSTEPQTFMGGLFEFISTYVKNPSGAMTRTEFEGFMRDGLQYGHQDSKVLFAAPLIAQVLSEYARDNWVRSTPGDNVWGIKVDAFVSGVYGYRLPVIVKQDWNEFASTNSEWGSWAFLVDMDSVVLRPLRGRNTKLLRNRQANDADETTEEYLTETSFCVMNEKHHLIIKNATSSA